jgi:hypothetical protein
MGYLEGSKLELALRTRLEARFNLCPEAESKREIKRFQVNMKQYGRELIHYL